MTPLERWACRNAGWRAFSARFVIPWVLAGQVLDGAVLELGSGAGANAAAVLRRFPGAHVTATDLDPAMVDIARARLASFGARATVQVADASSLTFADDEFDAVLSLIMLHHVGDWRAALAESARVLRGGGRIVGYDLMRSGPVAWLHGSGRSHHGYLTADELRAGLADAGFVDVLVERALGGLVARVRGVKPGAS